VKVLGVAVNHRKARLELRVPGGRILPFPFALLDPQPSRDDRVRQVRVDPELGREAVTFVLESGAEGSVHVDHALEYNQDPTLVGELIVYRLTVEAQRRVRRSGLSRRELARRLKTSVPQLYRLLDPKNTKKSLTQLLALLHSLGCDVELVIKDRNAA